MSEIRIPDFWETIENHLSIDSNGIKEIKEILSLLNYTTIQSITKFVNPKEIKLIELEFIRRQKEFSEKYSHLSEFTFGSGTSSILRDIAIKVKKKFVNGHENSDIDIDEISKKILADGKKICSDLSSHCISIEQFGSDTKCFVRCPKCGKCSSLSIYYTTSGIGFRLSNFIRHLDQAHANQTQDMLPLHNTLNHMKVQLSVEKLKNKGLKHKLIQKNWNAIKLQKENMETCFTSVSNTSEQFKDRFEVMVKKNNELQLEIVQLKDKIAKFHDESNDEGFTSANLSMEDCRQKIENSEIELEKAKAELFEVKCDRRDILHSYLELKGKVRVACRLRPVLNKVNANEIQYDIQGRKLRVSRNAVPIEFKFDEIFGSDSNQGDIFGFVTPLIKSALDGYCTSVIAYGQTGSGKTHTINGSNDDDGIAPRAMDFIYKELNKTTTDTYSVNISVFELYDNKIFDLIEPCNKPTFNESLNKLASITVTGRNHCVSLWRKATLSRRTSATIGNNCSSRSHAITQIDLTLDGKKSTINFVDLAGSEKPHDSSQISETKFINSSLSSLATVVMNLRKKLPVVDFSQSILTKILKSSLNGDAKTILFVNISTLSKNIDSTLNSLRFASSMSELKTK